jgi:hypothetical protein
MAAINAVSFPPVLPKFWSGIRTTWVRQLGPSLQIPSSRTQRQSVRSAYFRSSTMPCTRISNRDNTPACMLPTPLTQLLSAKRQTLAATYSETQAQKDSQSQPQSQLCIEVHRVTAQQRQRKTNCRNIEIPVLLPPSASHPSRDGHHEKDDCADGGNDEDESAINNQHDIAMTGSRNSIAHNCGKPICSHVMESSGDEIVIEPDVRREAKHEKEKAGFKFLGLPIELRLKIYELLLPSRAHVIATQQPYNGAYYHSIPARAARTLYERSSAQPPYRSARPCLAAACTPESGSTGNLAAERKRSYTTYKLLTVNSHHNFPHASIDTALLRVNRQIHGEAEGVLYGSATTFDFGTSVDAIIPFLSDRSMYARRCIKRIKVAKEMPAGLAMDQGIFIKSLVERDSAWDEAMRVLATECAALRCLEIAVWCERRGVGPRPAPQGGTAGHAANIVTIDNNTYTYLEAASSGTAGGTAAGTTTGNGNANRSVSLKRSRSLESHPEGSGTRQDAAAIRKQEPDARTRRECEYIARLLNPAVARSTRVSWYGFENTEDTDGAETGAGAFGRWLVARRTNS